MSDNEDQSATILSFTQSIRRKVVNRLTTDLQGAELIPDDAKTIGALNQTLDSMDRQALVLKRLAQDKKRGDDDRSAALLIATLNERLGKEEHPFRGAAPGTPMNTEDPLAELTGLPPITLIPGEDYVGIEDDSYDKFLERLEADPNA